MIKRVPFTSLLLLIWAAVCSTSCGSDTSGPGVGSFPDISGGWSVSMTAVPSGTNGADGSCTFGPMVLDLVRSGTEFETAVYTGSHLGTRVTCVGFTAAATALTGWGDTVIVVPQGNLTASVRNNNGTGCFFTTFPCRPGINAGISITNALTLSGPAGKELMSGDLYFIDGDTIRLQGSWNAVR